MTINKRNHLIDLLRFISASSVALFHFNEPIKHIDNWYRDICKLLWLGVPVFFIISGYCIFISINHVKSANQFIIRRFFRIFPNYWFSLFVVSITVVFSILISGTNSIATIPKSMVNILATVGLLTAPLSNVKTVNWVYWTLTFEVFFYLTIYLILLFQTKYRFALVVLVTIISVFIPKHESGIVFFLDQWPTFSIGISLYYILHGSKRHLPYSIGMLAVSFAGMFIKTSNYGYYVVCILITMLIITNHFKPLRENFFAKLGDYSYSIYLIHVPVGCYIIGHLNSNSIQNNLLLNLLFNIGTLVIIIGLSMLIYNYIEKPMIDLGKRISIHNEMSSKLVEQKDII